MDFTNTFGAVRATAMAESIASAGSAPSEPKRLQTLQVVRMNDSATWSLVTSPLDWPDAAGRLSAGGGWTGITVQDVLAANLTMNAAAAASTASIPRRPASLPPVEVRVSRVFRGTAASPDGVEPGADPRRIELAIDGADTVEVDGKGDLRLEVGGRELYWRKPKIYQDVAGVRREIAGSYVVDPPNRPSVTSFDRENCRGFLDCASPLALYEDHDAFESGRGLPQSKTLPRDGCPLESADANSQRPASYHVAFRVAAYDPSLALVIDPVLAYSTYLGGGLKDTANAVAVDSQGSAYVTGSTQSLLSDSPGHRFPTTPNSFQPTSFVGEAVFVTKFNPAGNQMLYSTILSGRNSAQETSVSQAIAVDAAGRAVVAGWTDSTDFPTKNALQPRSGGGGDAFVAKLNPDGSALMFSTYVGESNNEFGRAIAVDRNGNAYVAGSTSSADFPTVDPIQAQNSSPAPAPGGDAFLFKLNADGSGLLWSTYLGGSVADGPNDGSDAAFGVTLDSTGALYVENGRTETVTEARGAHLDMGKDERRDAPYPPRSRRGMPPTSGCTGVGATSVCNRGSQSAASRRSLLQAGMRM